MGDGSLRQAIRSNRSQQQVVVGRSIPAPVGGWNAQAPLANMKPEDAVILDNWIPRPGYVEIRNGSRQQAFGVTAVETLMTWRGAGSPEVLLAASGGNIYDASVFGSAVGAALYTGALNARWSQVNFSNDAGSFLICVNGANTPTAFNGTAFSGLTITGSSGSIVLDPTTLVEVMAHKNRLFFFERDSLRVWFLDITAIQGAAQLLDLGPVFQKGGSLNCMRPWSLDGGQGADDFAVFMTDQGEVAIYQGTDPSDATNWAEVGTYSLGIPLGSRSLLKYGSDLAVLTTDGVVPLSQALKMDRGQDNDVALTQKIQDAFSNATRQYRENFGWQGMLYPAGSLAIFNIPIRNLAQSVQFVQNMQTGAWCRFTGLNAICWTTFEDRPYFGGPDGVFEWDVGSSDSGVAITADLKTAFNYFGQRGRLKQFTMIRPLLQLSQTVLPALEVDVDYKESVPTAIPTVVGTLGALWDEGLWDDGVWSDTDVTRNDWTSVTGVGYCGAARMRVITTPDTYVVLLATGDGDDVLGDGEGNDIAVSLLGTAELDVRLISFDLMFQAGGQL